MSPTRFESVSGPVSAFSIALFVPALWGHQSLSEPCHRSAPIFVSGASFGFSLSIDRKVARHSSRAGYVTRQRPQAPIESLGLCAGLGIPRPGPIDQDPIRWAYKFLSGLPSPLGTLFIS